MTASNAILSGVYFRLPHHISISIDFGELAMLEVITAERSKAHAPRSQIWPEFKLVTASCFLKILVNTKS